MNQHEVKQLRNQSLLYEIVCEAISLLDDPEISSLVVADVKLARGKKDAFIYIDGSGIEQANRARVISRLQKASSHISKHILASSGWFSAPKLHFKIDDTLATVSRLDEIFAELEKSKK